MSISATPETFLETLERIGITAAPKAYIDPQLVRRWGYLEVDAFVRANGHQFIREHGNVYGRLKLVPLEPAAPAPVLRLITRSDHAAVTGSRRAA